MKHRRRFLRAALLSAAAFALSPFVKLSRAAEGLPLHHLPGGGFRNRHIGQINKPFSDLLKWRRESPGHPLLPFPLANNQSPQLRANTSRASITWIGHATVLLQSGGFNLLTDPHFSLRASPLPFAGPKRGTPPGIALDELPELHAVLISHNHYDHLDSDSIRALARRHPRARFFCPLGLADFLRRRGVNDVAELDWEQSAKVGDAEITAAPCQHWSSRSPWDRNKTLWASWIAKLPGLRFIFIGDTGHTSDFADIGKKHGGFDWAAIPIGAYEPRWFMREAHINPGEAADIFSSLRAQNALATHWGTFQLTDEPMDEPPQKLQEAMAQEKERNPAVGAFHIFQHGETRWLDSFAA